jgi:glutaredoxin 3
MTNTITLYTKDYCPYCKRAVALLTHKGVNFTNIEIGNSPKLTDEMVERAGGRRTVPQIFIDNLHVGGADDLFALDRAGLLDGLLGLVAA